MKFFLSYVRLPRNEIRGKCRKEISRREKATRPGFQTASRDKKCNKCCTGSQIWPTAGAYGIKKSARGLTFRESQKTLSKAKTLRSRGEEENFEMRSWRKRWSVVAVEREKTDFLTIRLAFIHSSQRPSRVIKCTFICGISIDRRRRASVLVALEHWCGSYAGLSALLNPRDFSQLRKKIGGKKTRNNVFLSPFPSVFPCALWERTAQQRRRRIRNALETAQHAQPASMCIGGN